VKKFPNSSSLLKEPLLFSQEQESAWLALDIGPLYDTRESVNERPIAKPTVSDNDGKPIDEVDVLKVTQGARVVPIETEVTSPSTQSLSALDWRQLREAVSMCNQCGLSQSRTQTVFAAGQPGTPLAIVGEAPGEEEDLTGEPFVGRAGQLLNNMLKAIGLERTRDVVIFNSLKCRPPANRNPSVQELSACVPFLERQLDIARPAAIFLTGKFAVQAILKKDEPIASLRGQVFAYTYSDGAQVPVLVTYHPAYYLRRPTEKAKGWEDLLALKNLLK
jgi:uracil-DNA glycosylase